MRTCAHAAVPHVWVCISIGCMVPLHIPTFSSIGPAFLEILTCHLQKTPLTCHVQALPHHTRLLQHSFFQAVFPIQRINQTFIHSAANGTPIAYQLSAQVVHPLYVLYVCIDILEHSTISVAITAQSPYQVYSMQEHKSNTQFTQPRNSLQIYTQACISARHFSHSVRPTRVWL